MLRSVVGSSVPFHSTVDAELKPLPFTVSVKVSEPACTSFGESCVTQGGALNRSPVTVVFAVAWLLEATGSKLTDEAIAVTCNVPATVGVVAIVMVAELPLPIEPRSQ